MALNISSVSLVSSGGWSVGQSLVSEPKHPASEIGALDAIQLLLRDEASLGLVAEELMMTGVVRGDSQSVAVETGDKLTRRNSKGRMGQSQRKVSLSGEHSELPNAENMGKQQRLTGPGINSTMQDPEYNPQYNRGCIPLQGTTLLASCI